MKVHQAEERGEIDIPISEVILDGGKLDIKPNAKKYFSIDYKPQKENLTLVAGGFIGLIPINEKLAIDIRPKFSISNLSRIVSVAESRLNNLNFFSRTYSEEETRSALLLEFLAECLVDELKVLEAEGMLKVYVLTQDISSQVKGRINIPKSITELWGSGKFHKAAISFHDFTADNPFNRLIKSSLDFCIRELNYIQSSNRSLINFLIRFHSMFEPVPLDEKFKCWDYVSNELNKGKISDLRNYYINICKICGLLVQEKGIGIEEDGEDIKLNSFTLDMADTFEKYLLNTLRSKREVFPEGVLILDGNKEGRKKFYNSPSIGSGEAKPDIIIKLKDEFLIIADAKYKNTSKESDRYQAISHALSYGAKIAILILPLDKNRHNERLVNIGCVGSEYQVNVFEYYFDLANPDLNEEESMLGSSFNKLISLH